jgi:CBS domain-containing protein
MMICPSCSFENIQGLDQCENCGADLRTSDIPHPGNVLEARLVSVHLSDMAADPPLTAAPGEALTSVIARMQEANQGSVLVRDGDRIAGIFTERDALMKVAGQPLDGRSVGDVMTADPVVLREEDSVAVAIHKMAVGGFRHIPIMHDGDVAAIVTSRDIFRYVTKLMTDPGSLPSVTEEDFQSTILTGGLEEGTPKDPGGAEPLPGAQDAPRAEGA